jgi:hypothetical protein
MTPDFNPGFDLANLADCKLWEIVLPPQPSRTLALAYPFGFFWLNIFNPSTESLIKSLTISCIFLNRPKFIKTNPSKSHLILIHFSLMLYVYESDN